MKITIAKTAGFCMGVRRAVELVLEAPRNQAAPIYTYGPLIHNPQVLELLTEKGVRVLSTIPPKGTGTVLIRAHGVPPRVRRELERAGFHVIDATCPRVIKVQRIIAHHAARGYGTIIVGDQDHPEVAGLLGYAEGRGQVVDSLEALADLPVVDRAIIVAQTTANTQLFDRVTRWAQQTRPTYRVFNTICDSTAKRQAEVQRLAETVDAMIVVGGRTSGNTRRLAEIAAAGGTPVSHIETETDLNPRCLTGARSVGITAGASTPNWVIKRVYRFLETLPPEKSARWHRLRLTVQRTLLLTNIYVALGAGCLTYAGMRLQRLSPDTADLLIAMFYVQSMHILNNLTGSSADRYNDPARGSFYLRYRWPLALLAFASGGIGLVSAFTLGTLPFAVLLIMSLLGLSYNIQVAPRGLTRRKLRRLRDIPGSKTILIALAWGVVTALLPSLTAGEQAAPLPALLAVAWATGMVLVRTAFFDVLDMQGDRIVGTETIPLLLGERRSVTMLHLLLGGLWAGLLAGAATGVLHPVGYWLAVCPLSLAVLIRAHQRGYMLPGTRLEFLVESHFILAGGLAVAGSWV